MRFTLTTSFVLLAVSASAVPLAYIIDGGASGALSGIIDGEGSVASIAPTLTSRKAQDAAYFINGAFDGSFAGSFQTAASDLAAELAAAADASGSGSASGLTSLDPEQDQDAASLFNGALAGSLGASLQRAAYNLAAEIASVASGPGSFSGFSLPTGVSLPTGTATFPSITVPTGTASLPSLGLPTDSLSLPVDGGLLNGLGDGLGSASVTIPTGTATLPSLTLPTESASLPIGSGLGDLNGLGDGLNVPSDSVSIPATTPTLSLPIESASLPGLTIPTQDAPAAAATLSGSASLSAAATGAAGLGRRQATGVAQCCSTVQSGDEAQRTLSLFGLNSFFGDIGLQCQQVPINAIGAAVAVQNDCKDTLVSCVGTEANGLIQTHCTPLSVN